MACTGDPGETGADGPKGDPGDPGSDGANALVKTSAEPAGDNCPNGGTKIEVGVDADEDGALDASEVTSTSYVCDGDTGTGLNSLVSTSAEPAGDNCPFGGTRIETGLDADNDGVLDASEINAAATNYVCNVSPGGSIDPSTGINAEVIAVTGDEAGEAVTVRFTLKDDRGFPIDINGFYSKNLPIQPRFALSYFTTTGGIVSPLTVYTKSGSSQSPTAYSPKTSTVQGTIVENGYAAGDYTYSFPTTGTPTGSAAVLLDGTKLNQTHVVWIQASRQTDEVFPTNANTYYTANEDYNYVPDGSTTPSVREIATQGSCDSCHNSFKPETTSSNAFHSGGRIAVGYCNVCHNPGRTSNLEADSASFIHRIHNGHEIAEGYRFHGIAATYPQSIKNCAKCHGGAANGSQAFNNPKTISCKGCHANVTFANDPTLPLCSTNPKDANGFPAACKHIGTGITDAQCAGCHADGGILPAAQVHQPVVPPDPKNIHDLASASGGSSNTHASWVAGVGFVPTGAEVITYDLRTVTTVTDGAGIKRPSMTFRLLKNGQPVVFQDAATAAELIPNFIGAPSVYFAWAVPQDDVNAPTDFNVTASGYLKALWKGTGTGTGAGTLSYDAATGLYTATLTGVQVASDAVMLTGGLGYSYNASSTPPLVQTNLADYPTRPGLANAAGVVGGLSVPAPNVWKVATGYTGRRQIVDNGKCNDCHGRLGVGPSFHAGQRNDGPTCSFCHTANRASAGWSAGSKYAIHALHAGRKRTVPFTWYAASQTSNFSEIEFPGTLNNCSTCHVNNTYDFTSATNLAQLANELLTTVASGTYSTDPLTNSTYYRISPYVTSGTAYGSGFSYNTSTAIATPAAPTTLVLSPITGACSSCHDSPVAIGHMRANGGEFYTDRATALSNKTTKGGEQCLVCHGPGRSAAIGEVHQR